MSPADLVNLSATFALLMLIAALLMTTIRVIAGPSLADRVLGLDMLVAIVIGFIAVFSIRAQQFLYVDIALALALVGFLSTIAFARYIAFHNSSGGDGPAAWPAEKKAEARAGAAKKEKTARTKTARPPKTGRARR